MIKAYLLVCSVSLLSFFCLSILFKRLGIVDKPDGIRKTHKGEMPLSGGFSIFISFIIGCKNYLILVVKKRIYLVPTCTRPCVHTAQVVIQRSKHYWY